MSGVLAVHDLFIFGGCVAVGIWLRGVGKIVDRFDKLLAPAPLGCLAVAIIYAEMIMA